MTDFLPRARPGSALVLAQVNPPGSPGSGSTFAATAILLSHPQGDLLLDAGFGSDVAAHVHAQPWFARAPYQATGTVSGQFDAIGYDGARLRGVLITHSHWDPVSGLDQLQVPIWTNAGELQYPAEARDGINTSSTTGRISASRRVPMCTAAARWSSPSQGGHTTGSVVVFVTSPTSKRYAFIGDLTWQLEGVRQLAERPFLMRKLADVDPGQVRDGLLRVASPAGLMQVVPAHDVTACEGIPRLPVRPSPFSASRPVGCPGDGP